MSLSAPGIPAIGEEELVEATRTTYDGPLVVGYDLMGIKIGETIEVFRRGEPEREP